jgi:hypothetical protein
VVVASEKDLPEASTAIRNAMEGFTEAELVVCRFVRDGAKDLVETQQV